MPKKMIDGAECTACGHKWHRRYGNNKVCPGCNKKTEIIETEIPGFVCGACGKVRQFRGGVAPNGNIQCAACGKVEKYKRMVQCPHCHKMHDM